MPSLVIDNEPTEFFYTDSGKPDKEIYTTLVIVHGHTFHGGVFRRIFPLASSRGMRVICLNRRDYVGTTLYSAAELEVLTRGTETERAAFMEARGLEIALFLDRIIDELSLPRATPEGNDGGLALMGWSFGNTASLAAVAAGPSLPTQTQSRLKSYLRRLIVFDAPFIVLGLPNPTKFNTPLDDETIPPEQRGPAFAQWVSSFFVHGNLSTRDLDVLNQRTPDPSRKPTITNMSSEEFASSVDFSPAKRSEEHLIVHFSTHFSRQASRALFDREIRAFWPQLDVWYVYADSSPWNVIYAAWDVEKRAKASPECPVKFKVLPGQNHFVFWDEPEQATDVFSHCLHN